MLTREGECGYGLAEGQDQLDPGQAEPLAHPRVAPTSDLLAQLAVCQLLHCLAPYQQVRYRHQHFYQFPFHAEGEGGT